MLSLLADGVAAFFILVDVLFAPFDCPYAGLDLVGLGKGEGLALANLSESSLSHHFIQIQ